MPLVWNPQSGTYVRVQNDAEQTARMAARETAQANMLIEKKRQDAIRRNRASNATETEKMALARVNTPYIAADYAWKTNQDKAKAAAAAKSKAEERIFGRRAGRTAAADYEAAARGQYDATLQRIKDLYAPEASALDAQRTQRLQMLADAISGAQGDITSAQEDFLKYLPTSTAYQNVPLVNLPIEQNPLLAALQQQGAGTGAVEAQRALDMALSQQLQQLGQRSAEQTGTAEQQYLDALRRSGVGAGAAGLQYLAQQKPALEAAYQSEFDKARAELARQQAEDTANAEEALRKALLDAAKVRMETTQEFGPPPKKPEAAAPKEKPAPAAPKAPAKKKVDGKAAAKGQASAIEGR